MLYTLYFLEVYLSMTATVDVEASTDGAVQRLRQLQVVTPRMWLGVSPEHENATNTHRMYRRPGRASAPKGMTPARESTPLGCK